MEQVLSRARQQETRMRELQRSIRDRIFAATTVDEALEVHMRAARDGGLSAKTIRKNRAAVDGVRRRIRREQLVQEVS